MTNRTNLKTELLTTFQNVGQTKGLTVRETPPTDDSINVFSVHSSDEQLVGLISVNFAAARGTSTTTRHQDNLTVTLASLCIPENSDPATISKLSLHAFESMFTPNYGTHPGMKNHMVVLQPKAN